jgi:protein-tyrosine phosphatase
MAAPAPVRVLFVCIGNLCRSPAASGIMRHLADERGVSGYIECDSAGTIGTNNGKKPDRRMRREVKRRYGTKLEHRARQLIPDDLNRYDVVVAMDKQVLHDIRVAGAGRKTTARLRMMGDYCRKFDAPEISDPFQGPKEMFPQVVDLLDDACSSLLDKIVAAQKKREMG